jgi:hypothetical protein
VPGSSRGVAPVTMITASKLIWVSMSRLVMRMVWRSTKIPWRKRSIAVYIDRF